MLRIGQVEATATQDGKYTDGSVAGGIAATRLRAAAFNAMQEELAHIVESAGLALDINDMTQVLKAIQKLTLSRANPFADIKSDGAAAISTALTNLGLGTASKRNVGNGDNQIPDMSYWTYGSGYIDTPLIKFRFGSAAGAGAKTFATPFPNEALILVFGSVRSSGGETMIYSPQTNFGTFSTTGFSFINQAYSGAGSIVSSGNSAHYLAIGR